MSAEEEARLVSLAKPLGIEQTTAGPSWIRLGKAAVLRDVLEGKIPERVAVEGHTANLMRVERPVWLFKDGIGIQRDAMSAKPQIFVLDDAWFAYNLRCDPPELAPVRKLAILRPPGSALEA